MAEEMVTPDQGIAPPPVAAPPTTPTAEAPAGPIFTQDQVNSILRDRVGALNTKHETALGELTAQLEVLKQGASAGDTPPGKKPEKDIEARMEAVLAPLRAKLEEAEKENGRLLLKDREAVRDSALLAALATAKAICPDQCKRLLADQVSLPGEDKSINAIDAEGNPRFGAGGNPMAVNELVAEFLASNPHFLPVSTSPGSGATGGNGELPAASMAITYPNSPELRGKA